MERFQQSITTTAMETHSQLGLLGATENLGIESSRGRKVECKYRVKEGKRDRKE